MNSINWPASSVWVFIAQLGEHCSANAEATGSNPVEAPKIFFSGYFRSCLNCDSLRWSHTHFICIPAVHIISFRIKRIQRKSEKLLNQYKEILSNKAEFKIRKGINKATPLNKNPRTETLQQIRYYNIIGEYVNNMNKLENIVRKKEGKGIIHFNNPQQLVKRLELLAGSIIAGNNGVKQEFSQIAHLLHQLKVITKKNT